MTIAICASMIFTEKMLETKKELGKLGHQVFISGFADKYVGKTEKQKIDNKYYYLVYFNKELKL